MNKIKKLLFFVIFSTATNACYATPSTCTTSSPEDLHAPLSIDNNIAIRFRMATTPIDPHGEIFPITIVSQECNSGEITKIADLPYLGDPGKIDSAFLADSDFDGIAELFVILRTTLYSDTGINYNSDFFTVNTYKRITPLKYEISERVRSYFGEGGDILKSPTSKEIIYKFPYKSEESIRRQLSSNQYKSWYDRRPTSTKVLRKTHLHNQANIADKTSKYLISGDEIIILTQEAGWLKATYHNNKIGDITGWILCKDTLECGNQKNQNP